MTTNDIDSDGEGSVNDTEIVEWLQTHRPDLLTDAEKASAATRMVQARFLSPGDNVKVDGRWELVHRVTTHPTSVMVQIVSQSELRYYGHNEEVETR